VSDGDEVGYGRRWCDIARRTGRSIVRRRRGGGGQFKAGNDDDDVLSFSKKIQDKGLNFLSHCGNRKDVSNSGGSINGKEKKKTSFRFRSSVCAIVQQLWSGECSFFFWYLFSCFFQ
jgi:hypothetical protein